MTASFLALVLVLAVGVERVIELLISNRNARAMIARGGVERGASHYPVMVAIHTALLVGCLLEARIASRPFAPEIVWPMVSFAVGAQALRWWAIGTLGSRWSTRVVVIPGEPRIVRGPYRLVPHPNYLAVVLEGLALPLACSAWITAAVFTVANAALLAVRIRSEEGALDDAERVPVGARA
jgi:methyltransferase